MHAAAPSRGSTPSAHAPAACRGSRAPEQRFVGTLRERRRRAAQQQELAGAVGSVDEDPEHWKKLGHALHLVDHDQPLGAGQRVEWPGKTQRVARILRVELQRRFGGDQLPGKGGLSRLPGACQDDRTRAAESRGAGGIVTPP